MRINDRIFIASAYFFGIPALYIVLTENKKKEFIGYHGVQAFYLWACSFAIFFALRFLVNLIWSFFYIPYLDKLEFLAGLYMAGYAVFCGYRSFKGEIFKIPH